MPAPPAAPSPVAPKADLLPSKLTLQGGRRCGQGAQGGGPAERGGGAGGGAGGGESRVRAGEGAQPAGARWGALWLGWVLGGWDREAWPGRSAAACSAEPWTPAFRHHHRSPSPSPRAAQELERTQAERAAEFGRLRHSVGEVEAAYFQRCAEIWRGVADDFGAAAGQ